MPSGLIEDENGVSTGGDFGCDFVEVKLSNLSFLDALIAKLARRVSFKLASS